ncbi:MAG: MFS transporter [Ruthenibacterium sp.]
MFTILLILIYIAFISLGLPDALLGCAWPSMYPQFAVPVSYAGIVSMLISAGTIVSSLASDRLIRKLGTGKVTACSVFMTAVALFGFSVSHSFLPLLFWAIPYGLGAGSVDAALNNFVALHYKARHMSWLHCFWGLGASIGPYIMGFCLTRNLGWNSGFRVIFLLQIVLTAALIFSLPLWKKSTAAADDAAAPAKILRMNELLRLAGAKPTLLAFFCYCAIETTAGLWGSTYLVLAHGMTADAAAQWLALFYVGITVGRFLSGFVTLKINDCNLVRLGQGIGFVGIFLLFLPLSPTVLGAGFVLLGMGCAPIFPSLLHATPLHFGKDVSQSIMGMQMACAYIGNTFAPPVVGLIIEHISINLYPFLLLALLFLMILMTERLNQTQKNRVIL